MQRILAVVLILQLAACSGSKGAGGNVNSGPNGASAAAPAAVVNAASEAVPGPAASSAPPSPQLIAAARSAGKDPASALALVQSVRYEIYPGVFRGSSATLADGAGNDYDRALLLHDLVTSANPGTAVRYAFCARSPQQVDAALAAARTAYVAPNIGANAQYLAQNAPSSKLRDGFVQLGNFWKAASAQAQSQETQISGDFEKAGAALSPQSTADLRAIAADHVWVQVQQQGNWIDLDPSVANGKPGATACSPATTGGGIPIASYDTVGTTLWLETRGDAGQNESRVASQSWRTADLANQSIVFAFAEPLGLQSPAPEPSGLRSYTPVLLGGMQITAAAPIVVTLPQSGAGKAAAGIFSQAASALGSAPATLAPAATPNGPVPVALRLDVTVTAPNEAAQTVRRPIFDRISAADRAAGRDATATLAPVAIYPFGTAWSVGVNFGSGVAGGGPRTPVDPNADDPQAIGRALGAMQRAYYSARRAVFADALGASAPPVIAAHPTITFVGLTPFMAGPIPYGLAIDRAKEGAAPLGGNAAASLAWGVASVYGERVAVAMPAMMKKVDALDRVPFDDVLEMFFLARNANVAPAVVRSGGDVAALALSEDAKARLAASIAGGAGAVVPSKPVGFGGSSEFGWWTLGTDGSVSDEMQNGMHVEMAGEAIIEKTEEEEVAITYKRNGFLVRCAGIAAAAIMALSSGISHGEGAQEIAEQSAEQANAIRESNEAEEMREEALKCGGE